MDDFVTQALIHKQTCLLSASVFLLCGVVWLFWMGTYVCLAFSDVSKNSFTTVQGVGMHLKHIRYVIIFNRNYSGLF